MRSSKKNQITNSGIRITVTGGLSPDGYTIADPSFIISQQHFQPCSARQIEEGIKLISIEHKRQLPEVKTIDYLMAIHSQPLLMEKEADDILYHNLGMVTECPRANFFIVTKNNEVVTPSGNILKGITRKKLIEFCSVTSPIKEKNISLEDVYDAKEAFITSSTKKVLPVRQVDHVVFKRPFSIATALSHQFDEQVKDGQRVSV